MNRFIHPVLLASAICCGAAQATYVDAVDAVKAQQYSQAFQEFEKLQRLGNADAAYNLGLLASSGKGVSQNVELAFAYFQFAQQLGHSKASSAVVKMSVALSESQQQNAQLLLAQLHQQQQVVACWSIAHQTSGSASPKQCQTLKSEGFGGRKVLHRQRAEYPKSAAKIGLEGFVKALVVVNEQGQVDFVDVVNSFPDDVFIEPAITALKQWQFSAEASKSFQIVQLDFNIRNRVKDNYIDSFFRYISKNELWSGALAHSDNHQYTLGRSLTALAKDLSVVQNYTEPSAQSDTGLTKRDYAEVLVAKPNYPMPEQSFFAEIKSDKVLATRTSMQGDITDKSAELGIRLQEPLVSKSLADGWYQVKRQKANKQSKSESLMLTVKPVVARGVDLNPLYWIEQAAINGNRKAQRELASFNQQWRDYLLSEGDEVALARYALDLAISGKGPDAKLTLAKINSPSVSVKPVIDYVNSLL